jgi:hypothetical protein
LGRHCLGFPALEAEIVTILHAIIAAHQRGFGSDYYHTMAISTWLHGQGTQRKAMVEKSLWGMNPNSPRRG